MFLQYLTSFGFVWVYSAYYVLYLCNFTQTFNNNITKCHGLQYCIKVLIHLMVSHSLFLCICQLWDINMDSGPVATFQVHEYLRPKVRFLYMEKG